MTDINILKLSQTSEWMGVEGGGIMFFDVDGGYTVVLNLWKASKLYT